MDSNGPDEQRELCELMTAIRDTLKPYNSTGHILTDDRAPVELLGMREIDSIIREELTYYKKVFDEEGLSGLLRVV